MKQSILDPPDPLGSEAAFLKKTMLLFRAFGWRCSHAWQRPAKGRFVTPTNPGFPDLVCLRPPVLVVLELKSLSGVATPEQRIWINGFQSVPGVEAFVVNPADWPQIVNLARDGQLPEDEDRICAVCDLRQPWCICPKIEEPTIESEQT